MWAKIKARRNFFLTTCAHEMLDISPESSPCIAQTKLNVQSVLFLSGTKVSLIGILQQWLEDNDKPGPTKKQKSSGAGQEGMTSGGSPPRNDGCHQKAHHTIEAEWKRQQHLHNPAKSRHCYRGIPPSNWVRWQLQPGSAARHTFPLRAYQSNVAFCDYDLGDAPM